MPIEKSHNSQLSNLLGYRNNWARPVASWLIDPDCLIGIMQFLNGDGYLLQETKPIEDIGFISQGVIHMGISMQITTATGIWLEYFMNMVSYFHPKVNIFIPPLTVENASYISHAFSHLVMQHLWCGNFKTILRYWKNEKKHSPVINLSDMGGCESKRA